MKCDYHKEREAVDVCNNCGRHLCKECHEYKEKYMLCPKCNEEYITFNYQNLRRGVYLTVLSLACAIMLLAIYIYEICVKRATKNFIILGGIFCGIFVPFCILFCLFTIINLVKTKKKLLFINSVGDNQSQSNTEKDKNKSVKVDDTTKKELQAQASQQKSKAKKKKEFVPNDLISQKEYDHLKMLMEQQSQNFTAEQLEQYDLKEFEELEKEMDKKKKKKWGSYGV